MATVIMTRQANAWESVVRGQEYMSGGNHFLRRCTPLGNGRIISAYVVSVYPPWCGKKIHELLYPVLNKNWKHFGRV